ncbi:hypothetical protein DH2020_001752 [Rehmannia glutinosa]|uniref:Protein kinase domain-containing protein n=1 Tax=Rehmannia glutinosa TaxID=99300 RepID=A0ABR0XSB5_REHGL
MATLILFILLIPPYLQVNSQNLSSEQTILLSLKQHWGNPPSLESWTSNSSPCDWPQVDCTFGAVTGLSLAEKNISGTIPSSICQLNNISRHIPVSLYNCSNLESLDLSLNDITGTIPGEFFLMKRLHHLSLYGNRFYGEIPTPLEARSLESLDLSDNHLNGSIPDDIRNLYNLIQLDLSMNSFSGTIPTGLFHLHQLNSLFLGYNNLSGQLPTQLDLFSLEILNLTHNHLRGKVPKSLGELPRLSFAPTNSWGKFSREFVNKDFDENCLDHFNLCSDSRTASLPGNAVAVKSISNSNKSDHRLEKEFLAEIQTLGTIRHYNLVKLLCCISGNNIKLLVYQYFANKSLDQWLHGRKREISIVGSSSVRKLDWPMRLHIAIGAAQGLCYMHHDCSPPVIHRDIKSSNILLDSEFNAEIADFGLAKLLNGRGDTETASAVAGTFGYIAPVNTKSDVYSFGVVLLELTTGSEAVIRGDHTNLAGWAQLQYRDTSAIVEALDAEIKESIYLDQIIAVFRLGVVCTVTSPSNRPSMKDCLLILLNCSNNVLLTEGKLVLATLVVQCHHSGIPHNLSRIVSDIGVRRDVMKISVERLVDRSGLGEPEAATIENHKEE